MLHKRIEFFGKGFFSKRAHIFSFLRISLDLLKNFLTEKFIFFSILRTFPYLVCKREYADIMKSSFH